ncbi:MAG: DUF4280 domain-containing protein [Clostridiaceae bacterium]|jgi:hypothetical protein|nr:DUF4280 domain-containing protein [Clostridiaceae bacterium]
MDSYVVEGATLKCSFGSRTSKLKIPMKHEVYINDKTQGNMMDYAPMVNVSPFGMCSSLANPTVASATAANQGVLRKMPCIPSIASPWMSCKMDVLIDKFPAVLSSSKLMCMWCGVIKVEDDGQ